MCSFTMFVYNMSWSTEAVNNALSAVKHGEKTLGEASAEFQKPKATLHRHVHGMARKVGSVAGRCPVLNPGFEEQLVNHIKDKCRDFYSD